MGDEAVLEESRVTPLSDAMRLIALPEISVKLALKASVARTRTDGVHAVTFEGETLLVHERDLELARRVAERLSRKMKARVTPGNLITACSYAHQFVADELFHPDAVRVIYYPTLSKANAFYRCVMPMCAMNTGTAVRATAKVGGYGREVLDHDVAVFQIDPSPSTYDFAKRIKEMGKKVVYEIDDAFDCLEPWHPQYRAWSTPERKEAVRRMMRLADAVTVSSEWLKDRYSDLNPNIHVIPNMLELSAWPPSHRDKARDTFRVVWAGADSHSGDLDLVSWALETFAATHPDVRLVFFGSRPESLKVDPSQVEHHPPVDFEEFANVLSSLDADVAIAPLVDCGFNRGKSNLRVIQYMACGWPVIASDVEPYAKTMRPADRGMGGLLMPENPQMWLEALLVTRNRADLRQVYAREGDAIVRHYDVQKNREAVDRVFTSLFAGEPG